ncbi:hypothetical protein DEO72_LG7g847 [Vigna unguiculata]|uniref:Uncharacterized protein n=1 Tax=Vigna unguiculata TaxID=3917 RepID=A0A4D6MIK5_VIGUN|nr:hypothetical protein DEO72_LG7g847 [Vigna unguiculata]
MAQDDRWTRAFLKLWLRLASVAGVSVRVVAHIDGSKKIAFFGVSQRVWFPAHVLQVMACRWRQQKEQMMLQVVLVRHSIRKRAS